MILRRLAYALKQQEWATVLVEFILVIAGVLIALQLDNWSDQQAQRLEEEQYLEQLLVEFVVVRDTVEDHIQSYANFRDASLEFVAVSQGDLDVTPERLSELYETGLAGRIPSRAPAALRELISAGKMGLVSNRELRTLLMRVDSQAETVSRVFDLLRTALLDQVQHIRLYVIYDTDNFVPGTVGTGENRLVRPPSMVDMQSLRQDPMAVASAKSYFEAQQNMLQLLTRYLARVEEVIGVIESELAA